MHIVLFLNGTFRYSAEKEKEKKWCTLNFSIIPSKYNSGGEEEGDLKTCFTLSFSLESQ